MSRILFGRDIRIKFQLGETISFAHQDHRLIGTVVREYELANNMHYHVDVYGLVYEVSAADDSPRRERGVCRA